MNNSTRKGSFRSLSRGFLWILSFVVVLAFVVPDSVAAPVSPVAGGGI